MLANNALAWKERCPDLTQPAIPCCRRTAGAPCPAPRAHAGGGGASWLLRDTRAGELPRLTYTLFILTLVSRAFVIFNKKLALHHRGEGVCQPGPLPESCSPAPCAGQIFRGAPFLQKTTLILSTLSLCEPCASPCRTAENEHSSCHMWDAPGLATGMPSPPAPAPSPHASGAAGGAGHPSLVTGSRFNEVTARCHSRLPC